MREAPSTMMAARELEKRFSECGGGSVSEAGEKLLAWAEGRLSCLQEVFEKANRNHTKRKHRCIEDEDVEMTNH